VRLILLRDRGLGINESAQEQSEERREGSSLSPKPDRPFDPPSYPVTPPPPSYPLLKIGEAIEEVARLKSEREEKKREVVE